MDMKASLMINMLWLCKFLWLTVILTSSAKCCSKENSVKRPRRRRPRQSQEGSKKEVNKDSKEHSKETLASCETKEKKDQGKVVINDERKEDDTQLASPLPQNPLLAELADTQDLLTNDEIKATQIED